MEIEIDVQDNLTQEVLEEVFKRGIAKSLNVSMENVVKLTVTEIGQGSGSRRLQSSVAKQYEVSYEVIPPSSMDLAVVVAKANLMTTASTAETQVFRKVLLAQAGIGQVKQVVPKVAAYTFEEEITTPAPNVEVGPTKDDTSGMSAGLIILIVLLVLLCLVSVVVGIVSRKMRAEKSNGMPIKDLRQGDLEAGNEFRDATVVREPSHTLLDGDAREAKKVEEMTCI
jgi:tRNA-binding EMAP/Myf-like protein